MIQEIVKSKEEIEKVLSIVGILRLPTVVYQIMFDGCTSDMIIGNPLFTRARHTFIEYIKDNYPDFYLESFIDLNKEEAMKLHTDLEWGMYFKLIPKNKTIERLPLIDNIKYLLS